MQNNKKKRKNENAEESKTKEETDVVHYSTGTRLVSFYLSFSFTAKWVDRSHLLVANLFRKLSNIYNLNKKSNLSLECRRLSGTFTSNEEKSFGTSTRILIKRKKKKINDTKDRSTVNFDSNESWLTNIQFVNEARSQPDLIQIILNAMCHIKFDVNYLLKPFCLFTR